MTERKIDVVALKMQFGLAALCPTVAVIINYHSSVFLPDATFTSYLLTSSVSALLSGIGFAYGKNALSEYKELKTRFKRQPSL